MRKKDTPQKTGSILLMPSKLLKQFLFRNHQNIILKFGTAQTKVRIVEDLAENSDVPQLSSEAAGELKIPKKTKLRLKPEGKNSLRLGPVIGIMTFDTIITNNKLKYYLPYVRLTGEGGFFYVFSRPLINKQSKTINGYYFDYNDLDWKTGEFPFPDVVIDRCYPNNYRCHAILEKEIGKKIFNKRTRINKQQFADVIARDTELSKHIPETRQFLNISQLDYYLERYGGAFLKPVNGMMGKGIVQVISNDSKLKCSYVKKGYQISKNVEEIITGTEMINDVLIRAAGRKRKFVIQQPISRMEYKGRPFSFRVWAMKNGNGQWVIPGMFTKCSADNGFLTNFTAGAELVSLNNLIKEILPGLPYGRPELISWLEMLTLKTAEALDKAYGPLGELGIDIILDASGYPWIIEANGNPGRSPIFLQKEFPNWRNLVYKLPWDYAGYLADFAGEWTLVRS